MLSKKLYDYTTGELNSLTPKEITSFTYANSGWKDQLVSVNGEELTYDENGNLLTYGDKTFSWCHGTRLERIQDGDNTYSYIYDENGTRFSKTVNGTTTQFTYLGGLLMAQKTGEDVLFFQYGAGGVPLGFVYNGVQYFYITNQLGDIIGITDAFSYIDNSTRLGFNAYIYCTNNPVMFIDHSGAKETYNITPQGLVVAIAINETFMIWDLLVIKDELNLNIDLNVSSLWDYAFFKQHVYKTAFDSGKYDNNYSKNMNINAKAGEFLSVFTDIFTGFFGGIASVIFSVFEFGADLLIDFSGRFFNGVGTAIMALYDTVSTTLNVLISNVISSFATPFAGIATGVGLSIVDELFTRDLVEVFAYSWHFIFNSLFSWWYDG